MSFELKQQHRFTSMMRRSMVIVSMMKHNWTILQTIRIWTL